MDNIETRTQVIYQNNGDEVLGIPPLFTVKSIIENIDTTRVKEITSIQVDYILNPKE